MTPAGSAPSTLTAIVFGRTLRQRLGGEHVLDLAGADAEGERAERAVGGGVQSPQTIVMPGWVRPSCGPMTCTMPWPGVAHRVQPDAELGAVLAQRLDLRAADDRVRRSAPVDAGGRRDVVVLGRDRQVGPAHRAAGQPQAVEGLRAGDLVHEVQVDVEQVGLALRRCARRGASQIFSASVRGALLMRSISLGC